MEGSFLFPLSWLKTKGVLQPCFIKDPDPFSFKEKKTPNCQPKQRIFQVGFADCILPRPSGSEEAAVLCFLELESLPLPQFLG